MYYGGLYINDFRLSRLGDGISEQFFATFRDDMYQTRSISAEAYWGRDVSPGEEGSTTTVHEFVAPGSVLIQRLRALGITVESALFYLQQSIDSQRSIIEERASSQDADEAPGALDADIEFLKDYNSEKWISDVREKGLPDDVIRFRRRGTGNADWLLSMIDYFDERHAIVLMVHVFPDCQVRLDITEMFDDGEVGEPSDLCSNAMESLRADGEVYAPVVVLTEGRTDAEFLSDALAILQPHMVDVIRFMDYERKPEGGAGALVGLVRAFSAAGIANRIVAIFDNDAAAADAMMTLNIGDLPSSIQVIQYPERSHLSSYPTIGPPVGAVNESHLAETNVNGLAGSIEMYLGLDVLRDEKGELSKIQWKSYMPKCKRYQGEVLDKAKIQERFRAKVKLIKADPSKYVEEEWADIGSILDRIQSRL
jgi:hypothetical protein